MGDAVDISFHYPPELLNLLVDTIPLLNRTKKEVVLFFKGAGVSRDITEPLSTKLRSKPGEVNKYDMVRSVLEQLNARGESMLRERREVLRRVVEFTSFDACWPDDQLKAKGLVASIRDVVNQKDSFTRMNQAREEERQARLAQSEQASREQKGRFAKIDAAKDEFYALFGAQISPSFRGKKLEVALNNLFKAYGILVREAFHLVGQDGEGIVEQIDGVIELKGALHFVEMKWYDLPVGKPEIAEHLVRLISRAEGRGIFISASGYTDPAIHTSREFLQHKLIALVTLQEIVRLLEQRSDLADMLLRKVQAAQIHKNPFFDLRTA
jgi:restriction system protein